MADISALSTEDLMRMRAAPVGGTDLSQLSTEELMKMKTETARAERTIPQRIGRAVGLTARAGIQGAAEIPALFANAAGGIYNDMADLVSPAPKLSELVTGQKKGFRFSDQNKGIYDLLTRIGLPEYETAGERVAGDVAGAMSGQGVVTGTGKLLEKGAGPVAGRVGKILASDPGLQTATAAAGTAAGSVARESGGTGAEQLAANLGTSVAVPAITSIVTKKPMSADTAALLAESKRRNVPLSYSDITGQGRRLDTMLEQAPVVGTSSFRESGAKKATAAMESFADDAKGAMQGTNYRGLDKLKAAAAAGDKSAKNTLAQIDGAGDDWTKIMQASGNLKLWRSRQAADELYGRVETIANTRGQVPLTGTNSALDSAIAAESGSKLPDKALIDKLTEIKKNLASGNDFSAIRQLRSDIGDLVQNYYKGANAAVGSKGVDKLQSVKNAVDGDMEAFATTNGGDLQRAWKRADEFYKTAVVPYKDKALAGALKSDLPDEIYRKFVQVGKSGAGEDRAQKFYDALDQKGKSAVRYGMIANAIDSASIPEKQGLLSPAKFGDSLSKIREASGVFFKGSEKAELDGFVNLMEHSKRFGQFTENPPTGQRVIPWLALGGAAIRPDAVAAVGAGALAARLLITTEAGKKLLLEASSLRAGTPEMQRLVEKLSQQMPRLAGQQEPQSSK